MTTQPTRATSQTNIILSLRFISVREINEGEELTVNYNAIGGGAEWGNDNWFDRMNVKPIVKWLD